MTTARLYSHFQPTLYLSQHLAQVKAAADFLWREHSPSTRGRRANSEELLEAIIASATTTGRFL